MKMKGDFKVYNLTFQPVNGTEVSAWSEIYTHEKEEIKNANMQSFCFAYGQILISKKNRSQVDVVWNILCS